jgi:hypothetical protein
MLIGTKLDLAEEEREVSIETAENFADDNDMIFGEISSMTGDNVDDAI